MDPVTDLNTLDSQPHNEILESELEDKSGKKTISIKIIDDNGDIAILSNITDDLKLSDLIRKSFLMFFNKHDKKSIFKFNIILIRTGKVLARFKTVKENELNDNDELLLVERYVMEDEIFRETVEENLKDISKPPSSKLRPDLSKIPNQSIIDEVTKKLKTKNVKKKTVSSYKSAQCNDALVQIELNNVFLALIEMSANLLRFNDVRVVYEDIRNKLGLDLKIDQIRLRQILDMGYGMDISKIALTLKKNNVKEAIQWLTTQSTSITPEDIAEFVELSVNFEKINVSPENFADTIKLVARYLLKRQEFAEVWEENVKKIEKIGFTEHEIRRALRKSFNEPNRACLFLMGEPYESATVDNDTASEVVRDKLLQDPEVLLALSDRNMLIGLLDLIDYPDNYVYLNEGSSIDDLLRLIIEVFENEKHYIHGCRDIMPQHLTLSYLIE